MKIDRRQVDKGPDAARRTPDLRTLLVVGALMLNVAAVVWKGGEISQKFTQLQEQVETLNRQLQAQARDQNLTDRTLTIQGERQSALGDRLVNHENRITRLEDKTR